MKWKTLIGVVLTLTMLLIYLVVSTGFAKIKQQDLVCNELRITVCDSLKYNFIRPADIKAILASERIKTIGERMYSINTYDITQLLNTRNVIKNAAVFTSIDGVLHIDVYQRRPIMRVQTAIGSFYIDESGYIFSLSGAQAANIPIVTGKVPMNIPVGFQGEIPQDETFLQQAYQLALYLDENSLWQSQIARLDVASAANVRIIPKEGAQIIYIGSLDDYQYKFRKLSAFYSHVCLPDDSTYASVDLRYSNQIVCKKRK